MGNKRSRRLRDRARNHGAGVSRHEPAGSQADKEARRFSDFDVRNANIVNVGTTRYVKGAPVINIYIGGQVANPEALIFNLSTRLAGGFPDLLAENAAPDPFDILYPHASRLWPDTDYQDRLPTDRPVRGRSRHIRNDTASSDTRHKTLIDGLPEHQQKPPNQQHTPHNQDYAKTLAERTQRHQPQMQHTVGGRAINGPDQREVKIGRRQRLRRKK
ncbi:hypothetical protein F5Y07DRAFT_353255 [Xylaria sp. FL0933]|nr:hypothetical protein F5Y07DRAFT_353255 [Xylaria sp. FL0933]